MGKTCNVPRNDDAPRDRHYYEKNDTHVITKKYAEADDDCSGDTKADDEEPIGSCFVGTPSGSVFIEVPALVLVSGALADERFTTFTGYNSATEVCEGDVKYLDHVSSCAPVDSKWATVSCNDTHATLVKFDADGCTGTASSTEYMDL